MTITARPLVKRVYFSARTHDDSALADVAVRVNRMLNLSLVHDASPQHEIPVMSTTVLGLEITLSIVNSMQSDAPQRYQISARQPFGDRSHVSEETQHVDGWLLRVLNQHEPGVWYRASMFEVRVDVGLDNGRVQDVWNAVRRAHLSGLRQAPEAP
jgi:hypothetical protein